MLKKDMPFIWTEEGKEAFQMSIIAILTQKYEKNEEYPIAFFIQTMNSYEEKYTFIKKQVLAILKSLNRLKYYVAQSRVLVLTIHSDVRSYIM